MKTYEIDFTVTAMGMYRITARNQEEALRIAKEDIETGGGNYNKSIVEIQDIRDISP